MSYGAVERVNSQENEEDDEQDYFEEQVEIPSDDDYSFSWRKLWLFTGPGFLMSIAFLDPGNVESDLQAGTIAEYKLLWVLLWSTVAGLLVQRLAARLGTVTGRHLAEICYDYYPKGTRYALWITVEIAIIGSDMQEVIGTAIALYIISKGYIHLWMGVLITILDTLTFLFLDKYGLRKLELFFAMLISTMVVTFGYEYVKIHPDSGKVAKGLIVPECHNCGFPELGQAIGIIGACVMPHNLYLHSALVKSRKINREKHEEVKDANRYVFIEAAIALAVSLVVNVAILAVFAMGLHGKTNGQIYDMCLKYNNSNIDFSVFPNNTKKVDANLYKAGVFLACRFADKIPWPMYVWAIGLFAAGQSSTMTGTYSGQFVMEGFVKLNIKRWKRVFLTRSLAIVPTLIVSYYKDIKHLSGLNDFLNAVMSLMLPFALIPLISFTCSEQVMGRFKNGAISLFISVSLSLIIIGVNLYFVYDTIRSDYASNWIVIAIIAIVLIFYLLFVLYLTGYCMAVLGIDSIVRIPGIGHYFGHRRYNIDCEPLTPTWEG